MYDSVFIILHIATILWTVFGIVAVVGMIVIGADIAVSLIRDSDGKHSARYVALNQKNSLRLEKEREAAESVQYYSFFEVSLRKLYDANGVDLDINTQTMKDLREMDRRAGESIFQNTEEL